MMLVLCHIPIMQLFRRVRQTDSPGYVVNSRPEKKKCFLQSSFFFTYYLATVLPIEVMLFMN